MRIRILCVLALQCACISALYANTDVLVKRYREYLFRTSQPQLALVNKWEQSLNPEGKWPDIDYKDKQPAGWKPSLHLERVREMALVWAWPEGPRYHDQALWKSINLGLDHWLQARYKSTNWWHNQIGVPRLMRDIIVLTKDDLNPDRLARALEVMAQLEVHDDYLGGNLIWCADLGLHYGALTGNEQLISRCRNLIVKEIHISDGEGIRPDLSFHQHGKRLQMYQYGRAYLVESSRIAWQLRGTPLAFPDEKVSLLTDFVLNGWQWMARGINTVPGTMDRSSSRKDGLQSADLRFLIPFLIELQPEKAVELNRMAAVQNGKGSLNGFRYYPYSDFAVFHQPGFSYFLKTISNRTYATESINNENLKGRLLNSGDAYLIRDGQEYFNLMPMWDWTALPGVTTFKNAAQIDRQSFVGSVSDGAEGLTVMHSVLKDEKGTESLSVRKFWACYKGLVVNLFSDLKSTDSSDTIYTALDQCRWRGEVTVNKISNVLTTGSQTIDDVKWLHHAGFAYIPLQPSQVNVRLLKTTGSWKAINASSDSSLLHDKVFLPLMLHSSGSQSSSGYVLAAAEAAKQAAKLAKKPSWKILRNDKDCQAVQFKDGVVMVAFYAPSKLLLPGKNQLQADQPCLLLQKNGALYVSDPSHQGLTVHVSSKNKTIAVALPKDGFSIKVEK